MGRLETARINDRLDQLEHDLAEVALNVTAAAPAKATPTLNDTRAVIDHYAASLGIDTTGEATKADALARLGIGKGNA